MTDVTYVWGKGNRQVRGVITLLNSEQFNKDELNMNIEMIKAGWSLKEKRIRALRHKK